MALEHAVMERLVFTKYLYSNAVEQSERPNPLCSASILTFHDSVELFLHLASECLDAGKKDVSFVAYWDILNNKLGERSPGTHLTQKEAMRRLDKARGELKHYGIRPSKSDIENFRASVTNFFMENTPTVFSIEFSDISLVDLVQCDDARKNLKDAEKLLKENSVQDALSKAAIAFVKLINDYEDRIKQQFRRFPLSFGSSLTSLASDLRSRKRSQLNGRSDPKLQELSMAIDQKLAELVDKVKQPIDALQHAVKIHSLGLDYRKFLRFWLHTPQVGLSMNGTPYVSDWGTSKVSGPEDVQFCINFVIESAIIIQETDFA